MTTSPPSKTPIRIPLSALVEPPTQPSQQQQNPLHHISFGVRSYSASKTFYSAVLPPLGLSLVFDSESSDSHFKKDHIRTLGYGPDKDNEIINIFELGPETQPPGPGFHLALTAPTRLAVVEFHAAAVQNGGLDNGLPGVREAYGRDYFAAYVLDPDGYRLEVVCKRSLDDLEDDDRGGKGEGLGEKAEGAIERVEGKMGRKEKGEGKMEVEADGTRSGKGEGNGEVEFERVDVNGDGSAGDGGDTKHLYSVGEGTVRL